MNKINTLLTPPVRNYIVTRNWPKGLQFDLNEDEYQIWLIFFRDNWLTLSAQDQLKITEIVKETITTLRNQGVPIGFGRIETRASNT